MCVGYFNKQRKNEYIERQLHWLNYLAVADTKKNGMTIEKFWSIDGEKSNFKPITKKEVELAVNAMKNFKRKPLVN